jgi:hypothetical protein
MSRAAHGYGRFRDFLARMVYTFMTGGEVLPR